MPERNLFLIAQRMKTGFRLSKAQKVSVEVQQKLGVNTGCVCVNTQGDKKAPLFTLQ